MPDLHRFHPSDSLVEFAAKLNSNFAALGELPPQPSGVARDVAVTHEPGYSYVEGASDQNAEHVSARNAYADPAEEATATRPPLGVPLDKDAQTASRRAKDAGAPAATITTDAQARGVFTEANASRE